MKKQRRRSAGLLLAYALLLLGCDATLPRRTTPLLLTFCYGQNWVAYQNEGEPWTYLGNGPGPYVINATPRLIIGSGWVREYPSPSDLVLDHLTPEQAAASYECPAPNGVQSGWVHGTISGTHLDGEHGVSYGFYDTYMDGDYATFDVMHAGGTADLVAARFPSWSTTRRVDRLIIRRNRSYAIGSTIPALDFESSEAFSPVVNTLSWTGSPFQVSVAFHTRTGAHAAMTSSSPTQAVTGSSLAIQTVPAAQLMEGDLHEATIGTSGRVAIRFFRNPADISVSLGAPLATPSFADEATAPHRRLRVELPLQEDYGARIEVRAWQVLEYGFGPRITLRATREFLGATATSWRLSVPDLSGADGGMTLPALYNSSFEWDVYATSAPLGFRHERAADGQTVRSASMRGTAP